MRRSSDWRQALAASCLLFSLLQTACGPSKPYVNPLPPDRVSKLVIRSIRWSPSLPSRAKDPNYDEDVRLVRSSVERKLLERLGKSYRPGESGGDLLLTIKAIDRRPEPDHGDMFHVFVTAVLTAGGSEFHYGGACCSYAGAVQTAHGLMDVRERDQMQAEEQANVIYNNMFSTPEENQSVGYCYVHPNAPECWASPNRKEMPVRIRTLSVAP